MEKQENNFFDTRDFPLATTLLTLSFPLMGIDYQIEGVRGKPVAYFKFENTKELQDTIDQYYQKQLSVEPCQYHADIRSLKARINSAYKSPNSSFNQDR